MTLPHLAAIALVIAALAAIFALARQSTKQTGDLALRTEQLLARLIAPTGTGDVGEPTWCGLTIRRLAHIAEYGLLGLAAGACATTFMGLGIRSLMASGIFCLLASVADEVHKMWVPGRHFDAADIALDIVGFLPAILLIFGIAHLMQ